MSPPLSPFPPLASSTDPRRLGFLQISPHQPQQHLDSSRRWSPHRSTRYSSRLDHGHLPHPHWTGYDPLLHEFRRERRGIHQGNALGNMDLLLGCISVGCGAGDHQYVLPSSYSSRRVESSSSDALALCWNLHSRSILQPQGSRTLSRSRPRRWERSQLRLSDYLLPSLREVWPTRSFRC